MPRGMIPRAALATPFMVAAVLGCDRAPAPVGAEPARHASFLFGAEELWLTSYEVPARPPVAPGSDLSAAILSSDAPGIVSIQSDGTLVAHANGEALIHDATSTAVLRVHVLKATGIRLVLSGQAIAVGETRQAQVFEAGGKELPAKSVRWSVTRPDVAIVSENGAFTPRSAGSGGLVAEYGDLSATVKYQVVEQPVPEFAIYPLHPQLTAGGIVTLQALSARGPIKANWSSSSPNVVAALGAGTFRAARAGESQVCATAGSQQSCTSLEVRR